jgi:urea carboxylase/allophanate hydrolase
VHVLGDGAGRVLCAGERDCSLRRRNQKVVEKTPATFVPLEVRQNMIKAAATLVASLQYRNVGTVEFIFDIGTCNFYFLEMNTRLQVAHPVTEAVIGPDLVKWMLHIAIGDCATLFALEVNNISTKALPLKCASTPKVL